MFNIIKEGGLAGSQLFCLEHKQKRDSGKHYSEASKLVLAALELPMFHSFSLNSPLNFCLRIITGLYHGTNRSSIILLFSTLLLIPILHSLPHSACSRFCQADHSYCNVFLKYPRLHYSQFLMLTCLHLLSCFQMFIESRFLLGYSFIFPIMNLLIFIV